MVFGNTKAWFGSNKIELTKDTDTIYVHPTSKVCDYVVDTSQIYARLEVVENKVNNSATAARWMYTSNATWTCPATGYYTVVVIGGGGGCSYSGQYNLYANGGTGYIVTDTIKITVGTSVTITIGVGGSSVSAGYYGSEAGSGKSSSFGSYLTAGGGEGGYADLSLSRVYPGAGSRNDGYGYDIPSLTTSPGSRGAGGAQVNSFASCAGAVVIW